MNCPNCGGAMQLSPSRGYFTCRYCGTFHFPEGSPDQGVRVLGPTEPALSCPACGSALVLAHIDGYGAEYCQNCRGVRLQRRSFAEIVTRRRAWADNPPVTPDPPGKDEMRRRLSCPSCHEQMTVDHYYGPGNVVLDRCERCDTVWLDYGELKQIVDAPGADRGSHDAS